LQLGFDKRVMPADLAFHAQDGLKLCIECQKPFSRGVQFGFDHRIMTDIYFAIRILPCLHIGLRKIAGQAGGYSYIRFQKIQSPEFWIDDPAERYAFWKHDF